MGLCASSSPVNSYDQSINNSINQSIHQSQLLNRSVIKILLLGAGECGKSTILKQMKILHKNGFTIEEKQNSISIIYNNILQSIQSLIRASINFEFPFNSNPISAIADEILSYNTLFPSIELINNLITIYNSDSIQKSLLRSSEFTLLDSAIYFLSPINLQRILQPGYNPTDQDILRSRLATSGIIETDFWIDKLQFKMFDVGGQRGERKKWIHCFEDVRAILFIASLNEYDQVLIEDRNRNRLIESLSIFEGIISLPWFRSTAIILFLNKNDLFSIKILKTDLGIYFSGYCGGLDYDEGLEFIKQLYFSRSNQSNKQHIYCHVTDATDTKHISFVWQCTKLIVMEHNLQKAGFIM